MLKVLVTKTAIMRTILDLRDSELLRVLRYRCELIEVLVVLSAIPNLDLPRSMFGTGLDDVDVIAFDHFVRMNGLHALGTKCVGLSDLLCHEKCIHIP